MFQYFKFYNYFQKSWVEDLFKTYKFIEDAESIPSSAIIFAEMRKWNMPTFCKIYFKKTYSLLDIFNRFVILHLRPWYASTETSKESQHQIMLCISLHSILQKVMTGTINSREINFRIQALQINELLDGEKCSSVRSIPNSHYSASYAG